MTFFISASQSLPAAFSCATSELESTSEQIFAALRLRPSEARLSTTLATCPCSPLNLDDDELVVAAPQPPSASAAVASRARCAVRCTDAERTPLIIGAMSEHS